ncbi:hypothetical protein BHM03_00057211, partial [Ensete ventricosum]
SIEEEKGKKKRKRKKEEGNKEYLASAVLARLSSPHSGRLCAVVARGSPAAAFSPMRGDGASPRARRQIEATPLVDIAAAVSSALLMNEIQWLGLIVKPIKYSLKGALLSIDTGPGLMIDESHMIEIDDHVKPMEDKVHADELDITKENAFSTVKFKLVLENGKVALPDWASDITTVLWFPVRAIDDRMAVAASAGLIVISHRYNDNMKPD